MRKTLLLTAVVLASAPIVSAQAPRAAFEVASVKKLEKPAPFAAGSSRGTVYARTNVTLASLAQFAYNVQDFELIGGPDWIRRDQFEIQGRASREMTFEEMRPLVQSLLEDRFKLVVRREQREMRRAELTLAREDGRLGPALKPCVDPKAPLKPPTFPRGAVAFGMRCQPISSLSHPAVLRYLQMPVVDKTGLAGLWDFQLFFGDPRALTTVADASVDPNLPPFETALRDQLGLEVAFVRAPVDVLIVESAQQPTEN
jgi:uncharacterized protein (TIGR03435 family)